MILIRKYRLRKSGKRGHILTIPEEYVEDAKLQAGQKMAIYRDGEKLVLVPEVQEVPHA